MMKHWVTILALLLPLLCGGGWSCTLQETDGICRQTDTATDFADAEAMRCHLSETPVPDRAKDGAINRELCLTAPQGCSFSGHEEGGSGRRPLPHSKQGLHFLKGGKLIDGRQLHPFLGACFVRLSGARTSERYLHSICRLRL